MNEYRLTAQLRASLVGKTIESIDVEDDAYFGTGFTMKFTDGSSAFIESEGYEGVGVTVTENA